MRGDPLHSFTRERRHIVVAEAGIVRVAVMTRHFHIGVALHGLEVRRAGALKLFERGSGMGDGVAIRVVRDEMLGIRISLAPHDISARGFGLAQAVVAAEPLLAAKLPEIVQPVVECGLAGARSFPAGRWLGVSCRRGRHGIWAGSRCGRRRPFVCADQVAR
jgi:hypothetical protein